MKIGSNAWVAKQYAGMNSVKPFKWSNLLQKKPVNNNPAVEVSISKEAKAMHKALTQPVKVDTSKL